MTKGTNISNKKELSLEQPEELLRTLKASGTSSFITTVRTPTMLPEGSVAR